MRSPLFSSVLLLLIPSLSYSQVLTGHVFDATDSLVVSGAQVSVDGGRGVRSDGLGNFRISGIAPGRHEVAVRMLGYAAFAESFDFADGQTVTHDLHLTRIPRLLSQMVIRGRSMRVPSGFEDVYRRASMNSGAFLTRETIDSLNPRDVVALLHQVPFLRVSPNGDDPDRITTSRCRSMLPGSNVSGQSVVLFFNGVPLGDTISINEILNHLAPTSIQAVEVYNGRTSVPPTFQPACAAIAIWTRKG